MNTALPKRSICHNKLPVGSVNDKRIFIPFSSSTTHDHTGRSVYIDSALLTKFVAMVNLASFDGKMIAKHIAQLKSTAGGVNTNTCLNDNFLHMDTVKHVQIIYQLRASGIDKNVSVYITDIRPTLGSGNEKFGIYEVDKSGISKENAKEYADKNFAAMSSGYDMNIQTAADKARDFIPRSEWGERQSFDIVFIPSYLYNDLGGWITPALKTLSPETTAKKLAEYLEKTENHRDRMGKSEPITWVVQGESAKVLALAVTKVKHGLTKHAFKFINPSIEISGLTNALKGKHAVVEKTQQASPLAMAKTAFIAAHTTAINLVARTPEVEQGKMDAAKASIGKIKGVTFLDAAKRIGGSTGW